MAVSNLYDRAEADAMIARIQQLTSHTPRQWGKMTAAQMLAHCCVAYEMVYTDKHPRPNAIVRFMLRQFIKPTVVGEKPYKKSSNTAPQFLIKDDRDFDTEQKRLIDFINKTQELGASYFEGKESHSMGKFSALEFNNSFSKHLDHHLQQFGV